jgi:hypothetical protein
MKSILLLLLLSGCSSNEVALDAAKHQKILAEALNDPYVSQRIKNRELTPEEELNDSRLDLLNAKQDWIGAKMELNKVYP